MPTRRQEKVARIVKEAVSDAIHNHLGDPRITGLVSVTRVEMSPDMRNAGVYLSILGSDEAEQKKTFIAITHAKSRIQSVVADYLSGKFCPVLHIYFDDRLKKTMETLKIIEQASKEFRDKDLPEQ
jgi:ribosome-binding factor A